MRKKLVYFVLSIVMMGFLHIVCGDELNESDSQLMCVPCHDFWM